MVQLASETELDHAYKFAIEIRFCNSLLQLTFAVAQSRDITCAFYSSI